MAPEGPLRRRTALEEPFKALQELCSLAPFWGPLQGVPKMGRKMPFAKGILPESSVVLCTTEREAKGPFKALWCNGRRSKGLSAL